MIQTARKARLEVGFTHQWWFDYAKCALQIGLIYKLYERRRFVDNELHSRYCILTYYRDILTQ